MIDPTWRLYIDGKYVDATSDETFDSVNPATGEVLTTVQQAAASDVDRAVASSLAAFEAWSAMTGAERGRILNTAARILRKRNRELAELEVRDTGKPIQEAIEVDVLSAADAIEYYGGLAAGLHGDHFDLGSSFAYTRREPLGVCVGIGAWNYPIQIAGWKSAPALACGNTMIYKPAELTPITASKLAEVYTEAGVPDGVFNVVQGDGSVGAMLTAHANVAKVSLTGEVGTGKKVMENAAGTLKQITLELGGKSPLIIFSDADLDNAASAALLGNFYTQGEVCSNGTRVFVQREIYGEFLDRLKSRVGKIKVGDPMDPETHVGALITPEHMAKVLGYIEAGKAAGATLIAGGGRVEDPALANGNYVQPTIFADAADSMSIATDEIFGPVMTVLPFDGEDEVIARANNTHYGLAAGVFTRDVQRAHRVVAKLEAGTIWINNYNITPVEIPFGGYKQSGIGRENSLTTIDHYTQLKTVYVEGGDVEAPY